MLTSCLAKLKLFILWLLIKTTQGDVITCFEYVSLSTAVQREVIYLKVSYIKTKPCLHSLKLTVCVLDL